MAKKRGFISPYRTYLFTDKDPVIDFVKTVADDHDFSVKKIHETSDVSTGTLYNWFSGKTRRPQFTTIAAVLLGMGRSDINLRALSRRNHNR